MAMQRFLIPDISDSHYFDDMFDDVDRQIARVHQDMRSAMLRITPPEMLSEGGDMVTRRREAFKNPITTNADGSKSFKLQYELSTFKPGEIKVKTEGNELSVEAQHEEKTDNSRVFHQFSRHYTLPRGVDPNSLTSSLSRDGVLCIDAPYDVGNALEGPPAKKQALEGK